MMVLQGVRHPISHTGVGYVNKPQKGGCTWRPCLRLIQQPLFEVISAPKNMRDPRAPTAPPTRFLGELVQGDGGLWRQASKR